MKRHLLTSLLIAVCSLFIISSCKEEPVGPETPEYATIVISTTEINAPFETEPDYAFQISYKLQNAPEGAEISVSNPVDWIYDLDLSKKGAIEFKVMRNVVPEVREATLTVTCPNIEEPVEILVKQDPGKPYPFDITIDNVTYSTMYISLVAKDKEAPYISFLLPDSLFKENDQEIFEDDMNYIAQEAEFLKTTFEENLQKYLSVGDKKDVPAFGMTPGVKYRFYAYYMDVENVKMASEVVSAAATTKEVERIDVKFRIESELTSSLQLHSKYYPIDYSGFYFTNYLEGIPEDLPEAEINKAIEMTYLNFLNLLQSFGIPLEEILNNICHRGDYSNDVEEPILFKANSSYINFAMALNEEALPCGKVPTYEIIETQEVGHSDNVITIDVYDIKDRTATIAYRPSNGDPYGILLALKSEYDSLEAVMTKDRFKQMIVDHCELVDLTGEHVFENARLLPDTEFYSIGIGVADHVPTTEIFKTEYKTPAANIADIKVDVRVDGYYDLDEVRKLDEKYAKGWADYPGYVFPYIVSVDPCDEGTQVWADLWSEAYMKQFTDDGLINTMIVMPPIEVGGYRLGLTMPGEKLVIVVFARDAKGDISPVYKSETFSITGEDAGDAQYFVDNYPWPFEDPKAAGVCARTCREDVSGQPLMFQHLKYTDVNLHRNIAERVSLLNVPEEFRTVDDQAGKPDRNNSFRK